jgi:hypothetical protein
MDSSAARFIFVGNINKVLWFQKRCLYPYRITRHHVFTLLFDPVFELCCLANVAVVIVEPSGDEPRKTMVDNMLSLLTAFSARNNDLRRH